MTEQELAELIIDNLLDQSQGVLERYGVTVYCFDSNMRLDASELARKILDASKELIHG